MSDPEPHLSPGQLADLCALADGTLDPRQREEVQAWLSSSSELQEIYNQQRRAVSLLHQTRSDRAPVRLRAQVERQQQRQRVPARRSLRFGLALAAPVAAAAIILALALPAGTPGAPSLAQAAALATRGSQQAAPAPALRAPRTRLMAAVQDLYFPNWATSLGWRAIGLRRDRLGGRSAITVYYAHNGRRVAYTILGTPALPEPNGPARHLDGYQLRTLVIHGRTVVTWRRAGHTCVISATGVPVETLDRLAAWR